MLKMLKFLTTKQFFQYHLPATLTLFMLVTIERTVVTDGGYDKLYGLPLPYISSALGHSFNYQVYILAMFFNLLIYFGFTLVLFTVLGRLGVRLKTHWAFLTLGILITTFWLALFILFTRESDFYFTNGTDYKPVSKKITFSL